MYQSTYRHIYSSIRTHLQYIYIYTYIHTYRHIYSSMRKQQVCPQSCGSSQKKKTEKQTTHQETQETVPQKKKFTKLWHGAKSTWRAHGVVADAKEHDGQRKRHEPAKKKKPPLCSVYSQVYLCTRTLLPYLLRLYLCFTWSVFGLFQRHEPAAFRGWGLGSRV